MTNLQSLLETERTMRKHVDELGLDFEAAHAVSSIYRAANAVRTRVTNDVLREFELSWTGFVVLWVVWISETIETRHAAEASSVSKATLTGVVRTLEARGWIEKTGRDDDRRLVELSLTPAGIELMTTVYPKFNAIETQVVQGVSREHLKNMTNSLRAIIAEVEESELTDPM